MSLKLLVLEKVGGNPGDSSKTRFMMSHKPHYHLLISLLQGNQRVLACVHGLQWSKGLEVSGSPVAAAAAAVAPSAVSQFQIQQEERGS